MGSGIAQTCAQARFDVTLHDQDEKAMQAALKRIREGLDKLVAKGRRSPQERDATMARLRTEADPKKAAAGADLVIEAIFEDEQVKGSLFKELDAHAGQHTIFATNTSSLSVTKLSQHTGRGDRFGGLHFFFPAMINRLLEVVRGEETSDETHHELMLVARRLGKVPVETKDSPGFCVNRFFVPFLNEACRLLQDGHADIPTIDAAANKTFGTPMGPFALMNATGPPITLHAQRTLHRDLGEFYRPAKILEEQVEQKKQPWDLEGEADPSKFETVQERLLGVTIGIATQLVEEGVASLTDTEKGATVGLAWREGPFALANRYGTHRVLSMSGALFTRHGDSFPVAQSLRNHGAEDRPYTIPVVTLREEGPVARITIERPAALNALNREVLEQLDEALSQFDKNDALRVAMLTGEGKAFVAGADLKTMADADETEIRSYTQLGGRVLQRIGELRKPVVAAVDGFALGGGLELALACDTVYASDRALVGLPETGLGIIPGFGGTQRLARRIGPGRANHMTLTGTKIDGEEAMRLGVVDVTWPLDRFHEAVESHLQMMAQASPVAVSRAKRAIRTGLDMELEEGLSMEQELAIACFGTQDQKEGFQAFMERRRPRFPGN
jgi:enoyl-CoA hydratase / 3-hydroxyacyl-CoA dehydrogenase